MTNMHGARGEHLHPRHVWASLYASGPSPGLLLEWRRTPDGWEGLVVMASGGGVAKWGVAMSWVDARSIEPAG